MLRMRGKEGTCRLSLDGQPMVGSFLKLKDWSVTPREEVTEDDFTGEPETDIDFRHDGIDFKLTTHIVDQSGVNFLRDIALRDRTRLAYPRLTVVIIMAYREPNVSAQSIVLPRSIMKMNELSNGSGKDYMTTSFEGKCKRASFQNL